MDKNNAIKATIPIPMPASPPTDSELLWKDVELVSEVEDVEVVAGDPELVGLDFDNAWIVILLQVNLLFGRRAFSPSEKVVQFRAGSKVEAANSGPVTICTVC